MVAAGPGINATKTTRKMIVSGPLNAFIFGVTELEKQQAKLIEDQARVINEQAALIKKQAEEIEQLKARVDALVHKIFGKKSKPSGAR